MCPHRGAASHNEGMHVRTEAHHRAGETGGATESGPCDGTNAHRGRQYGAALEGHTQWLTAIEQGLTDVRTVHDAELGDLGRWVAATTHQVTTMSTMPVIPSPEFLARIVAASCLQVHPDLARRTVHILPEGMSDVPQVATPPETLRPAILERLAAERAAGDFVVLGAGSVNFRKGVDLFLAAAMVACRAAIGRSLHFLWVGHGYSPDTDMQYSIYLREQVARGGLADQFSFLDEVSDLRRRRRASSIIWTRRGRPMRSWRWRAGRHGRPHPDGLRARCLHGIGAGGGADGAKRRCRRHVLGAAPGVGAPTRRCRAARSRDDRGMRPRHRPGERSRCAMARSCRSKCRSVCCRSNARGDCWDGRRACP
jgi:hypothetical protein